MKTADLKPAAESFGEVEVNLKFRTGIAGGSPAWQVVPRLFDEFLSALKESNGLKIWEAVIGDVTYKPFKETCGGKAFTLKVDEPIVRLDT